MPPPVGPDSLAGAGAAAGKDLTVSATELGYYASNRFCPYCAWVRLHVKHPPYQSFPGIFSTIDRYNKLIVQSHFQRENSLPLWLEQLGKVEAYIEPPHWSKFKIFDEESGITLRGEADGIFKMQDGSHTIVDYKTSRDSGAQRAMVRSYETQLNADAYIGERLGLSPVGRLALVYMEPQTDEETAQDPKRTDSKGFAMGFAAKVVEVELKPEPLIHSLLWKVKDIAQLRQPPPGLIGCKDCQALAGLIKALG